MLDSMPTEVIDYIIRKYLVINDIKSMRLVNKHIGSVANHVYFSEAIMTFDESLINEDRFSLVRKIKQIDLTEIEKLPEMNLIHMEIVNQYDEDPRIDDVTIIPRSVKSLVLPALSAHIGS